MTEPKPSSKTLEGFLEEGKVKYESDTAASIIYKHPPSTPLACDNTLISPNPIVKRDEVPLPIAQRAIVDPTSGVVHNTFDEDQAQHFQSVDDRMRQAQIVASANAHSGYRFTPPTEDESIRQTAGQSFATWITGPRAVTATAAIVKRDAFRAIYLDVERMTSQGHVGRLNLQAQIASVSALQSTPIVLFPGETAADSDVVFTR
uniref:Uncharacterized protein n=1 Tax=Peronospora matthiolae TaxID=2874970 RepID=A0AAV1UC57_9STRA